MFETDWRFQPTKLDRGYTAASRASNPARTIIPSPSNTNWNSTFLNNQPASPSRTDWQKVFGGNNSFVSSPSPVPRVAGLDESRRSFSEGGSPFSFNLSPAANDSSLRLPTSDFEDRTASIDLTTRDHELYGAGPDYGFTY